MPRHQQVEETLTVMLDGDQIKIFPNPFHQEFKKEVDKLISNGTIVESDNEIDFELVYIVNVLNVIGWRIVPLDDSDRGRRVIWMVRKVIHPVDTTTEAEEEWPHPLGFQ